jgi:hypothetical protein
MVLRFKVVCNVKGKLRPRFSVAGALLQAMKNQRYKCHSSVLSLLSPFFYLKTVASFDASLYNSGRLI